jgi:hypothetical protein
VRLKLTRKPDGVAVEVEFIGLPRHLARQTAEFGMAALLKGLRGGEIEFLEQLKTPSPEGPRLPHSHQSR